MCTCYGTQMMCVEKCSLKYVDDEFCLIVFAFFSRILLLIGVNFTFDNGISSLSWSGASSCNWDVQRRIWTDVPFTCNSTEERWRYRSNWHTQYKTDILFRIKRYSESMWWWQYYEKIPTRISGWLKFYENSITN